MTTTLYKKISDSPEPGNYSGDTQININGLSQIGPDSDLTNVNLSGANLTDADLTNVNFFANDFSNANLSNVDLSSANFKLFNQFGNRINGLSGESLSFGLGVSGNGSRIAIGKGVINAPVEIYDFNQPSNSWSKINDVVEAQPSRNSFFGASISLNNNGNILAVGGPSYNNNTGLVEVYEFQSSTSSWIQQGDTIFGFQSSSQFGRNVYLSKNGSRLAVSSPQYTQPEFDSTYRIGKVQIYEFQPSSMEWNSIGEILGQPGTGNSSFGTSIYFNNIGSRLAIGTLGNSTQTSYVRIYNYNDNQNSWSQLGNNINTNNDNSPISISLNDNGDILAVGDQLENIVKVYYFINNNWIQQGNDIQGKFLGEQFGTSVDLNNNGNILAVSSVFYDAGEDDDDRDGIIRIYMD